MRLFAGFHIDENSRTALVGIQSRIQTDAPSQGVRFVPPHKLHLTLAFFGDVPREGVNALRSIVAEACASFAIGPCLILGLGGFPNLRRPKTIWAGVQGDTAGLDRLASALRALQTDRKKGSESAFTPHITLARISPGSPTVGRITQRVSEQLGAASLGSILMNELVLFESAADGVYHALDQWPIHAS